MIFFFDNTGYAQNSEWKMGYVYVLFPFPRVPPRRKLLCFLFYLIVGFRYTSHFAEPDNENGCLIRVWEYCLFYEFS